MNVYRILQELQEPV